MYTFKNNIGNKEEEETRKKKLKKGCIKKKMFHENKQRLKDNNTLLQEAGIKRSTKYQKMSSSTASRKSKNATRKQQIEYKVEIKGKYLQFQ